MTPDKMSATKGFLCTFFKVFLLINVEDQQKCVLERKRDEIENVEKGNYSLRVRAL